MRKAFAGEMLAQTGVNALAPEFALYGALELKQCYQRNLVFGVLLAASLHVLAVCVILVSRAGSEAVTVPEPSLRSADSITVLYPPPPMTQAPPEAKVNLPVRTGSIGNSLIRGHG